MPSLTQQVHIRAKEYVQKFQDSGEQGQVVPPTLFSVHSLETAITNLGLRIKVVKHDGLVFLVQIPLHPVSIPEEE